MQTSALDATSTGATHSNPRTDMIPDHPVLLSFQGMSQEPAKSTGRPSRGVTAQNATRYGAKVELSTMGGTMIDQPSLPIQSFLLPRGQLSGCHLADRLHVDPRSFSNHALPGGDLHHKIKGRSKDDDRCEDRNQWKNVRIAMS